MTIYLNLRTAGGFGGPLKGILSNFSDFIDFELAKAGFNSSFNEFEINFNYPPMYVLPGVVGIEIDYKKYYDTLPLSRIDRRYKRLEVGLKAPEFSEIIQKEDQIKYEHKFNIESKYKNIQETELAKILIDKYLQAAEIIESKLTDDDFDFELFKSTLSSIKQKINLEFLKVSNADQIERQRKKRIKIALEKRKQRELETKPVDKQIRDLRIYYNGLPKGALYPYDYQYAAIFLNLLRKNGLLCPGYHHLYIQVAKTFDDGLINSVAFEDWYVDGVSVIDFDSYKNQTEKEKEETVFNVIVNGLFDIAAIDKLNKSIIEKTVEEIKVKGLETELEYNTIENKNYKLKITYFSKSWEEECPIYFSVVEKSTGRSGKIQIGRARNSQIYLWLQKIAISGKTIKIKSSSSITAEVWLENKPKYMEFNIEDILK